MGQWPLLSIVDLTATNLETLLKKSKRQKLSPGIETSKLDFF